VETRERSVDIQSCDDGGILIASFPIARTDFRTKSTSISVAYLNSVSGASSKLLLNSSYSESSVKTSLMFFSVASMKMSSSFVTLT
jgi:hypothetical protein